MQLEKIYSLRRQILTGYGEYYDGSPLTIGNCVRAIFTGREHLYTGYWNTQNVKEE